MKKLFWVLFIFVNTSLVEVIIYENQDVITNIQEMEMGENNFEVLFLLGVEKYTLLQEETHIIHPNTYRYSLLNSICFPPLLAPPKPKLHYT